MYQPCVVEIPGQDYRYKMWFFGWAVGVGNKGYPGCDAIFHARSKDLKKWEVYSGEGRWDDTMNPKLWVPVITADNKPYDAWHNGDPSVVCKDGRFYMAFTATGKPEKVPFHLDAHALLRHGGDLRRTASIGRRPSTLSSSSRPKCSIPRTARAGRANMPGRR